MGQLGVNGEVESKKVVVLEEEEGNEERENGSEMVRWDKMLRVLLVEADDSTRQIITALLRKCNYKVAAVSDGLEAWEILRRKHSNIDLVLTEFDLPSISGYALLTLIMEHDSCKNIPVIVMSSRDSIHMVLKCMLKGAADYLIKPVRRNELKNLWRHVWRRQTIKAGKSPQNVATGQCKVEATFENNPIINLSSDDVSSCRKTRKLSEKATDAQSSCTTPYLEAESACMEIMQDLSQMKQREETGLSHNEVNRHAKNVLLEKELALSTGDIGEKASRLAYEGVLPCVEANASAVFGVDEDGSCTGLSTEDGTVGPEKHRYRADIYGEQLPEPSGEAIDLIGRINNQNCTVVHQSSNGKLNGPNSSAPELELSLRRFHDSETKELDERHILNHSNASAFSWYGINKKSGTIFTSSGSELTDIKGSVADVSPWPKAFSSSSGEDKPNIPVAWATNGPMCGPTLSPLTGPAARRPRTPNSPLQREESPFLMSPPLHSDPGTLGETTNNSFPQEGHEVKPGNSHSVEPSGGSSTPCNDFATENKSSGFGSVSELTEVDGTAPMMMGTSAMEDDGSNAFDHEQFRSRTTGHHHSAEREAALAKFRLKRKERCYEKKVRYQSRKRLAEQRPRVKGQFVRQVPN